MTEIPVPPLPPYLTLLLTGALSAPWPLYVSLAHLSSQAAEHPATRRPKTLLFTSLSQRAFEQDLVAHNDAWLNEHCMSGSWSYLLDAIQVFHPSSPKDLRLLLSLVRPFPHGATVQQASPVKFLIDGVPSLIVLHELSAWFMVDSDSESHSLSDYLRLVTMALDLAKSLSSLHSNVPPTRLVLIDRGLLELRLPVVLPRAAPSVLQIRASSEEPRGRRQEAALDITAKYFDWIGVVELLQGPSSVGGIESPDSRAETHALRLRRATMLSGLTVEDVTTNLWHWKEEREEEFGRMFTTALPLW